MPDPRKYATPRDLRRALEDRLKKVFQSEGLDIQRLMRMVAFDQLLARLFAHADAPWVLKGGYSLELRLKRARATRDIDLVVAETLNRSGDLSANEAILQALRDAAATDLGDFFEFEIGDAMQDLDAAPYGGARFPVEARLDGRTFVRFHIDVAIGDVVIAPLETSSGRDWLGFAGIPAGTFPTISKEQHFAEKLHAYTIPRQTPNSRVRDLVDMVLLIQEGLDRQKVASSLAETFKRRKTHSLPQKLNPPPPAWEKPFSALARQCGLSENIAEAFAILDDFFKQLP